MKSTHIFILLIAAVLMFFSSCRYIDRDSGQGLPAEPMTKPEGLPNQWGGDVNMPGNDNGQKAAHDDQTPDATENDINSEGQHPTNNGQQFSNNEPKLIDIEQQPADIEALCDEFASSTFKREQVRFPRVRTAIADKYLSIKQLFKENNIQYPPMAIFLRAFKKEGTLELWICSGQGKPYQLLKSYDICRSSGVLGPKRQEGDRQVPEGFYYIKHFNPASNFFLSLGINYPNESDSILGVRGNLGGEIYIHGGCATIGCIPITDDGIKELYLLAVEARSRGQTKIPVHIFPARLDDEGFERLQAEYTDDTALIEFWAQLKQGYDAFDKDRQIPDFDVDRQGRYVFNE